MSNEKIFFTKKAVDRDWYFVEYIPPFEGYQFATVSLTFPSEVAKERICRAMEGESEIWTTRYPVPVMISAFDDEGDLINLTSVRKESHLFSFLDKETGRQLTMWELVANDRLPTDALDINFLLGIYSDFSYKTSTELQTKLEKERKQLQIGWMVVFIWAVVVPMIVAVLEWASPAWVALLVMIYSLLKAVVKGLKMKGKWKKSKRESEAEQEASLMRHHHYHCEQNPEGFERLKFENFRRWAKEYIQRESAALKNLPKQ